MTTATLYRCEKCGNITIHPVYHREHEVRPLTEEETERYIAKGAFAFPEPSEWASVSDAAWVQTQ